MKIRHDSHSQLVLTLFDKHMIQFGDFILKSGKHSYIYIDLRTSISYPDIFKQICDYFYQIMQNLHYDFICGVPYSALTFASGIAYGYNIPMLLKRKEIKDYGTKRILEGNFVSGQTCLLIEDIITTASSVVDTITALKNHHLNVTDVCIFIDRNQGGQQVLEHQGYKVHSVMSIIDILDILLQNHKISQNDKILALQSLGIK
jgi:orotate phosphoribosyltransferase